jgi:carboxyl-terminal processing protease
VRTNSGGDEMLARRLAAFFVEGEAVYAAHRPCDPRTADGFGERQDRRLRGNQAPDLFTRQVTVLTGPMNMSSCEAFLLMMKQSPRALLVGDTSYGSSGNPQPHTLLPGLVVMLPSWQALRPDGSSFEGEGITPHIHVTAGPGDFAERDPVLDAALRRLRGR